MTDVMAVLARHDGVARVMELSAEGVSAKRLRAAVDSGSVLRLCRGLYAVPAADPELVLVKRHYGELGCISAATRLGLWVVRDPERPHVAVDHARGVPGCVVHRSSLPLSPADVVCQSLRCLPPLEGLTIAESAVKQGLVRLEPLRERFSGLRDGPIRQLLARINPQSGSIIETMARFYLEQAGFNVQLQVNVPGMGHLDLKVDGLLGLEADGYENHSSRQAYREDRRRWNLTVVRGVPTLRITFEMLLNQPDAFVRLVREALNTVQGGRSAGGLVQRAQ
ncbi:MAG TPA: type IV toxin-antitoxin system AbiEi family antitoxin domain-containing protein [Micrococcaceae bacterium]|nr:type IV toxin-antitoxin system AbiEi family antitoxin domain-containing protein [Micrococcaceae bacterium]